MNFSEGLYIDYRYFDREGIEPRFEFGYGLSYSEFGYGGLRINSTGDDTSPLVDQGVPIVQGGHPALWDVLFRITCTIANTGAHTATETPQLYVRIPNAPERQLRGFEKVSMLRPGESVRVRFPVTRRDLSIWDVGVQQWWLQRGAYGVFVGGSSRDLRVEGTIEIN